MSSNAAPSSETVHVRGVTLNQFSITSNDQVVGIKGLSNIVESDGIAKVWVEGRVAVI